jgi:hypothetical protein
MKYLLCRNRVEDFDRWYDVFSSHKQAHKEAGLLLQHVFRSAEDPLDVFFSFRVESVEKAKAFMETPQSVEAREAAGVVDGEFYFVDSTDNY